MRAISLFSGIGGLDVGIKAAIPSLRVVCYVESSAYCRSILLARMEDGGLDVAPIAHEVQSFDGRPWRGSVDCLFGGFPCQDLSVAGSRRGLAGERSGLWFEFARITQETGAPWIFIENVGGLNQRPRRTAIAADGWDLGEGADEFLLQTGLGIVLGDLADLGYRSAWGRVSAATAGAPHERFRYFILAHIDGARELQQERSLSHERGRARDGGEKNVADITGIGLNGSLQTWRGITGPAIGGHELADSLRDGLEGADEREVADAARERERERERWHDNDEALLPPPLRRDVPFPPGQPDNEHDRAAWTEYLASYGDDLWCLDDKGRLNVTFCEAFMGFPIGWSEPGSRRARIAALGNSCIPAQAELAWSILWNRLAGGR